MRLPVVLICLFFTFYAAGQQTTQEEFTFLQNGVSHCDKIGLGCHLGSYSLVAVETKPIPRVSIKVRKLQREGGGTAGYSLQVIFQAKDSSVRYFAYPAKNGKTESYGWGLFFQQLETFEPEERNLLLRWFSVNLTELLK